MGGAVGGPAHSADSAGEGALSTEGAAAGEDHRGQLRELVAIGGGGGGVVR